MLSAEETGRTVREICEKAERFAKGPIQGEHSSQRRSLADFDFHYSGQREMFSRDPQGSVP